jgi:hypothetical protein
MAPLDQVAQRIALVQQEANAISQSADENDWPDVSREVKSLGQQLQSTHIKVLQTRTDLAKRLLSWSVISWSANPAGDRATHRLMTGLPASPIHALVPAPAAMTEPVTPDSAYQPWMEEFQRKTELLASTR